jgi:proline dehydrogenase
MLHDEAGKNVKQRAVDQIMKLIHSQLVLEKKQAKMDAKVSRHHQQNCPCELH